MTAAKKKGARITSSGVSALPSEFDPPQILGSTSHTGLADLTFIGPEYTGRVLDRFRLIDRAREAAEFFGGQQRAPAHPIATTRIP